VDESAIQTYSYQNLDHATSGDEPASPSPLSPMTEMNMLQSAKGTRDDLHIHSHTPSHASHPVPATFIVKALTLSRTRIKGATAATPTNNIHPVHTTRMPIHNVYPWEILSMHWRIGRETQVSMLGRYAGKCGGDKYISPSGCTCWASVL
jgi:hypothetical protein